MSRIPELEQDQLDEDQKKIYETILASRGSIAGPFRIWLHSPDLADRAQSLGEFLRYQTRLEPRLSELAILTLARFWDCQVEWSIHEGFARESGLEQKIIDALRASKAPAFDRRDEEAVYNFATELLRDRFVRESTFEFALAHLEKRGLVELTALLGYYAMVAMTLNAFQVSLPAGTSPLLPDAPPSSEG